MEEAKENTKVKRAELQWFNEPDEEEAFALDHVHLANAAWSVELDESLLAIRKFEDVLGDPENFRPVAFGRDNGH